MRKVEERDLTAQVTTTIGISEAHCRLSAMSVSRGVIATITHCIRARIRRTDEERARGRDDVENGNTIRKNEMINVTHYGSVNTSIQDVTRRRRRSHSPAQSDGPPVVDKMRRRLQFYFMNPLEKWHVKRQFPYKLAIQLIKIFFVTFQLCLFATYRYANVNYTWDNKITFSHLFLKDWDSSREITSYPPTTGPLAVYRKDDFYKYVNFAVNAYANIGELAIGPYFYENTDGSVAPMHFCQQKYVNGVIFGFNESYVFDSETETKCIDITAASLSPPANFSSKQYFQDQNFTISFDNLLEAHLRFTLKTVRFRDLGPLKSPDCFRFDLDILFNNRDHDGQTLVTLEAQPARLLCKGDMEYIADNRLERIGRSGVNYIVIGMCTLSLVLCCRAIYRAQLLKREAISFFKKYYQREMTVSERLDFLNFWYLLIILNDILIIVGSALKEQIENKELTGEAWNVCSLLLGVGNLLVWFGVLRYLGFFRTYNVLILTLKRATPQVLRFLICAILIYAGFTFCGWLILGPYHIKFSTLSTTSECLFALINGDDMFATFASMSSKSSLLWWFCRFYLYTFISLFIYVVLSLFIALIMDAYETIKLYYTDGFPRSMLEEFVVGADLINQQSSSPFSTPDSQPHLPNTLSRQQSVTSEMGRRMSVTTAGGLLDTIVETICGCNSSNPDTNQQNESSPHFRSSEDDENQPLLEA
ncbi:Mucolipin-3 [Orchesella cincta]|uniref:Mucolipin-3 n=1 Tax=Orchesella cincta TaxID=48709 RepID=A0A1D2NBQ1_ORCCI|nr:Mucolipin-3 [Orchesella cincta]